MNERVVFPLVMALLMAFMMSAALTAIFFGINAEFIERWCHTFLFAWPCASITVFIALPITRYVAPKIIALTGGNKQVLTPLQQPAIISPLPTQQWKIRVWIGLRWLMALMFIESFTDKILHWQSYAAETAAKGIPLPEIALAMAVVTEVLGSIALISGFWLRIGCSLLSIYVFVLGFFYFDFWNQEGVAAIMARKEFLKDLGIIAGLMLIVITELERVRADKK